MANRTANYSAFYVKTPFNELNLGAMLLRFVLLQSVTCMERCR